jgi:release factor glutamine methyltransferase
MRLWRELGSAAVHRFEASVTRRAAGEPLAYVTGQVGFRHLSLAADGRALIPRPETEQLVDLVLRARRSGRAADIGTGSGCIALSLAAEGCYDEIVAVELSSGALALAAENRARLDAGSVRLVRGDSTEPIATASLDVLAANPPYLTDTEWASLDDSVAGWEPAEALVAGPDGLGHTRRLLHDGRRVVRDGGLIALEVDCRRARGVAELAAGLGWTDVQVIEDLFGRERFVLALRSDQP